ncbi:MAG: SRPBCC family protein [Gaiellales bacterium]|nr:SRPBCC family protein [Gaiellales bacterium]
MDVQFSADVDAPAERLWDILTHGKAWPEWQAASHVRPPQGAPGRGTTFEAGLGGFTWTVSVTEVDRPRKPA